MVPTPATVTVALSLRIVPFLSITSAALVTLRVMVKVTVAPGLVLVTVKTGFTAVEPVFCTTIFTLAPFVTELAKYSIPAGKVSATSAVFFPGGILKLTESVPPLKLSSLAKCAAEGVEVKLIPPI